LDVASDLANFDDLGSCRSVEKQPTNDSSVDPGETLMISHLQNKLTTFLRGLLLGASAGDLTMAICNLVYGTDRAGHLANLLHLGNGIIFAILLGGVTGAWLALGSRKRIATFMGLILGVLAGWEAWRVGAPYFWMIDVILMSAFGEGAQYLNGFIVFAILYLLIRWVVAVCESVLLRVLSQPTPASNPGKVPSP
jgi:hypothetical protein